MKNLNEKLHNYDNLIYSSRPVKFSEYINHKYDKIHNQLYLDALNKFLSDESILKYKQFSTFKNLEDIKMNTKIVEIKNDEYWQPSHILVMSKKYPYYQHKYDLKKYWNTFQDKSFQKIVDIKMLPDDIVDAEIIGLNYVTGKATLESRLNGITFEVDFDYINEDTLVSDEYSLKNTFTNKYYYGN